MITKENIYRKAFEEKNASLKKREKEYGKRVFLRKHEASFRK